ncbi:cilia- and flagella-associated protein 119 isoform X2 [Mobula birostris]|uniref:cilia- and flagella-associated protein 119 isoform X2 n=1 Tax=Mobula birostris TaxID=1983395 RepID=UPI003B27F1B5
MVMEESDSGPSEQISDQFSYTRLSTSSAGVQMDYKRLEKPPLPEARICIWEDLTYSGMDVIEQAASMEELKLALAQLLCEPLQTCDPRGSILLDLYAYAVQFSRTHSFSKEQTSAFFSIVRRLHRAATGTPLGNVNECCQYFKELLLCHAVQRPPFSIDLFSAEQVKLITEYVIDTYFRHFKLYKYVFTPQIRMDLSVTYLGMPETPPVCASCHGPQLLKRRNWCWRSSRRRIGRSWKSMPKRKTHRRLGSVETTCGSTSRRE